MLLFASLFSLFFLSAVKLACGAEASKENYLRELSLAIDRPYDGDEKAILLDALNMIPCFHESFFRHYGSHLPANTDLDSVGFIIEHRKPVPDAYYEALKEFFYTQDDLDALRRMILWVREHVPCVPLIVELYKMGGAHRNAYLNIIFWMRSADPVVFNRLYEVFGLRNKLTEQDIKDFTGINEAPYCYYQAFKMLTNRRNLFDALTAIINWVKAFKRRVSTSKFR